MTCDHCECCCRCRARNRAPQPSASFIDPEDFEGYATWQRVVVGVAWIVALVGVMLFFGRTTELMFLGPLAGESHVPTKWMVFGGGLVGLGVWCLGPLEKEPLNLFGKGRK